MKTLFLVLGISALVALALGAPPRGRGPKGKLPLHKKLCLVKYEGGAKEDFVKACPTLLGQQIFDCELLDLTKVKKHPNLEEPEVLEGASEIHVCKPKKCDSNADCGTEGVCSDEPPKRPTREEMEAEDADENKCRPPPPIRPRGRGPPPPPRPEEDEEEDQDDEPRQKRCHIPKQFKPINHACRAVENGQELQVNDQGESCKCGNNSCEIDVFGRTINVYFCVPPPPPPRRGGKLPLHKKLCLVKYADQDKADFQKACPTLLGQQIFDCEVLDMTKVKKHPNMEEPEVLKGATEIHVCKPKKCDSNADCGTQGVCSTEPAKRPTREEMEAMENGDENTCRPPRPDGPGRRGPPPPRPEDDDEEDDDDDDEPREKRCQIPREFKPVNHACLATENGQSLPVNTHERPCKCSTTSCQMNVLGRTINLHFCERSPPPPPRGGKAPLHKKLCLVKYADQDKADFVKTCPTLLGQQIFDCEVLDMTKVKKHPNREEPEVLQGATEIHVCKPKKCESNSECGTEGVCSNERPKRPTREEMEAEKADENKCRPPPPIRPRPEGDEAEEGDRPAGGRPGGRRPPPPPPPPRPDEDRPEDDEDENDDDPTQKRCHIPKQFKPISHACRAVENGQDLTVDNQGESCQCSEDTSCTMDVFGRTINIHFCVPPPPPAPRED